MKPKSTAALLADRLEQRKAAQRPTVERKPGAPMFASVGQPQARGSSRSRLVLALAAAGVGMGSLLLAAQLFGWGRPEVPVRVHMMADQAALAEAALDAPMVPVAEAPTAEGSPAIGGQLEVADRGPASFTGSTP
jgi:hypothetical protein